MATNAFKMLVSALLVAGVTTWQASLKAAPVTEPSSLSTAAVARTNLLSNVSTNLSPDTSLEAPDTTHKLIIGDKLSLKLVEDLEEAKPVMVSDAGEVEVPYIGRVPAVGKTCGELAKTIKERLEQKYYYHVTVQLAVDLFNRSQGRVYLAGQVRIPGFQDIPFDEVLTVSKAILRGGGFGDFADKRHVKLTRKRSASTDPDVETIIVDVQGILEKGQTSRDVRVMPDDIIFVPERGVKF